MIILHQHLKGHQLRVFGAESNQLVNTCSLEVKPSLVKGCVMGVTGGLAGAVGEGFALSYTVNHLALLPCPTAFTLALHLSASSNTFTPFLTALVSPERLPGRDVSTLIGTTTLSGRHTPTSAQNKTCITGAGLHTGVFAFGWSVRIRTGSRTGTATELVAAVGWTFSSFRKKKENSV